LNKLYYDVQKTKKNKKKFIMVSYSAGKIDVEQNIHSPHFKFNFIMLQCREKIKLNNFFLMYMYDCIILFFLSYILQVLQELTTHI